MYYISELHMGGPTLDYKLMDSTDCWGPYKSLSKARKMFKEKVYKNKNLKSEGFYSDDLMDGDWKFYYDNGNIMAEGSFLNGNGKKKNNITKIPINGRTGNWTGWHENGVKGSELSFKNGKKHGVQKNWYENGQKELQGEYENGKPVRTWSWWYFDGAPMQEGEYNLDGKFEGLYFINPQVPAFTTP